MTNGCHNDMEVINALTEDENYPLQTGKNIEVQYTDSARLQLIFKAPKMKKFLNNEEEGAYYVFEDGIEVFFYDNNEKLESIFKSGYANYYEKPSIWKASDSVVARNIQTNEQLSTEELFWDQKNKRVYSHVFTKITNEDGVFYGEKGFESDQDLENYKLIGSSGSVEVEDEELP
ncbi:MAG: LPS export ABC transporter periplasmic protein LptC [Bacteroidales bacterium]|nr:LPS export ABC transporter periplasmic protein LptC [Bacteroidales bacterium]